MPKVIKPSNPFIKCSHVSAEYFLRRHKFWLHRQFSSPNSRNEEMMGDVSFGATAGLFQTTVC